MKGQSPVNNGGFILLQVSLILRTTAKPTFAYAVSLDFVQIALYIFVTKFIFTLDLSLFVCRRKIRFSNHK